MTDPVAGITLGELWIFFGGVTVIGGAIWGFLRWLKPGYDKAGDFISQWNGTPDRYDRAGKLVDKGKPSMPAILYQLQKDLYEVKSQVKNHHNTNLRDDLTKVQDTLEQVTTKVDKVDGKLSEHIHISKEYDAAQEHTAKVLDEHLQDTRAWHPMLKEMYEDWFHKEPPEHPEED